MSEDSSSSTFRDFIMLSYSEIEKPKQIIPAKHPNNCLYAFEVADWLPLARAYLSLQTGCQLLVRLNICICICIGICIGICICIRSVCVSVSVSVIINCICICDHLGSSKVIWGWDHLKSCRLGSSGIILDHGIIWAHLGSFGIIEDLIWDHLGPSEIIWAEII